MTCTLPNIKRIARQLRSTDGAEIAEAALVLPLVAMLLFGIIWFGRAFNIYSTIQQAAQQGAVTAARATCATCSDAFPTDGPPTTNGTVTAAVEAVLKASNLDPAQIPVNSNPPNPVSCATPPTPPCTTTDKITICRQALLNPVPPSPHNVEPLWAFNIHSSSTSRARRSTCSRLFCRRKHRAGWRTRCFASGFRIVARSVC